MFDFAWLIAGAARMPLWKFLLALAGISILGFLYSVPEQQRQLVEGVVRLVPVSTNYLADVVGTWRVLEARWGH